MLFRCSFYILILALATMAVLMIAIPLPQKDRHLRGYMLSRWMLTLSYIALGVYSYFKGRMTLELFSPVFLFMANLQACLLAMSHINLINPQRVTTRYVLCHFAPMLVCMLIYIVSRCFAPHIWLTSYDILEAQKHEPEVIARLIWIAQYVVLCFYFMYIFVRESELWRIKAEDYFADNRMISVHLIRASLTIAMVIGFTTFAITLNLHPYVAVGLNMLILTLYIALGILFLQYPSLFAKMRPVLYEQKTGIQSNSGERRWDTMRKKIIERKLFLRPGITLEQIAREIGVSRTILSNAINREEGMNFNAFINRLRIREAQRAMSENNQQEISLQQLAEKVGYTEASNFCREFKHWAGNTPNEWIKKCAKQSD